jgi:hypothetical protein
MRITLPEPKCPGCKNLLAFDPFPQDGKIFRCNCGQRMRLTEEKVTYSYWKTEPLPEKEDVT